MDTPSSEQAPAGGPRKLWRAGTLTYTTAALIPLFCWLFLGDFAWSIKDRGSSPILQKLLGLYHASSFLIGLLPQSVPQLVALVIVPILSHASDRHRGRWGRRIPFILVPAPIAALSIIGVAFGPQLGAWLNQVLGAHSPGKVRCIFIVIAVFWTVFEFSTMAVNVLFGALANDVVPREIIGRFFGGFRAVGLIAAMIFYFWIFPNASAHYFWIFVGMGLLYGIGVSLMCFMVKEGEYEPPPPMPAGGGLPFFTAAGDYLRVCFSKPYYLLVFATISLANTALVPMNSFNVPFAPSVGMSDKYYSYCLVLTYAISLLLAYPWGALADRVHPLRFGLVALAVYALVTLWGGLFARTANTFAIALVAHGVISGTWLTATASLTQRLLPNATFAQFYSAQFLIQSFSWAAAAALTGVLLDHTGHIYRYSYLVGSGMAFCGLFCGLLLYRKFVELGGPDNYAPPQ
jgi:Na+/melibiose symporter-like transporter